MKELTSVSVSQDDSVLIVIDFDNVPDLDPKARTIPEPNAEESTKARVLPVVRRLLDGAHDAGIPVIYLQSVRHRRQRQFTVFGSRSVRSFGTWNSEIVDQIAPESDDIVVRKWDHDPWFETDLEKLLAALAPDPTVCKVLVTGGGGAGCALFGALGFYARDFQTYYVMNALYGARTVAARLFSRTTYPTFPNVHLTAAELIEFRAPEMPIGGDPRRMGDDR
jgi:nicotinamidase-related amidase